MKNIQNKIVILILILIVSTQISAFGYPNCIYFTLSPGRVQFQLIDPLGNKTGYEPSINGEIEKIPNTQYRTHQLTGIDDKAVGEAYHRLEPKNNIASSQLMVGKYQLKIFGTNTTEQYKYDIGIFYEQSANDIRYFQPNKVLIYPNVVWTYEFDIPATPPANGQIVLTKVSTPADLIKDLTTAGQLGYIGNHEFVSEITKKINKIEEKRLKPDKNEEHGLTPAQKAKKGYTELLKEITEKYNKPESDEYVKKEAYDVLKEDLEYIINHI